MSLGLSRDKVLLVPHDPEWQKTYAAEERLLKRILDTDNLVGMHHFGSTSIPGIMAKPLMGILLEVNDLKKIPEWDAVLAKHGYQLRESDEQHYLYAKGPEHNRTVHLHVAKKGSEYADISLLFRDYLRQKPAIAKSYERVKINLAQKYASDRRKYTSGKDPFIKKIIAQAKKDATKS